MTVHPASAGQRIAAFGWDYLLMAAYIVLLSAVSSLVWLRGFDGAAPSPGAPPWGYDLLAFMTLVLPVILYFGISEGSMGQATWGKRRMGLRVVGQDGARLGTARSLLRSSLKFLPWQISHTCLFHVPGWPMNPESPPTWVVFGFGAALGLVSTYVGALVVSREGRTLYDRIAGSWVVRQQPATSVAPV